MLPLKVVPTPGYLRQSARLEKRYRSWATEADALAESLKTNPAQGTALGRGCCKIRVAVGSKNKGKSGGARVVTLVRLVGGVVLLLAVYDQSEQPDLAPGELDALLATAGL